VWGTSGNPEAMGLYLSAGLRVRRVLRDHRLALDRLLSAGLSR